MHLNQFARVPTAIACVMLLIAASTPSALADHHESGAAHDPAQHSAAKPANAAELTGASKEFEEALQKMHKDMTIPYSGDVDVDFVRGMIPHHQGAIDQANVFLKYTKDLRLRRLALGIIAAQRKEIRFMQRWLNEHQQGLAPGEAPASLDDPPEDPPKPGGAPAAAPKAQ